MMTDDPLERTADSYQEWYDILKKTDPGSELARIAQYKLEEVRKLIQTRRQARANIIAYAERGIAQLEEYLEGHHGNPEEG